jgi:PAS domain S-box-containing protein
MKKLSDFNDSHEQLNPLRERLIGLGESSIRKSHYPELQRRLIELQKFRALLDQSNDAIFLMNVPSGQFTDVNGSACQQLEYSRKELLSRSFYDFIPSSASELLRNFFISGRIQVGARETISTTLRTRKGGEIPAEITFSLVVSDGSLCAVAVARDITRRKQAEDALRKAHDQLEQKVRERTAELTETYEGLTRAHQELKANQDKIIQLERHAIASKVTSAIAHETRNPISVIGGFLTILKRRHADEPESSRILDIILKETQKLEHLVGVILKRRLISPGLNSKKN